MMYKTLWFKLASVVAVTLLCVMGMGLLDDPDDVTITTDILLGTTAATSALDSTGIFEWSPRFTITVGPGHNDTSFFTVGRVTGGYGDSIITRWYLRGWTSRSRNQLMHVTPLWGYAAPYAGVRGARPRAHLWASITDGMIDSTTRIVIAERNAFRLSAPLAANDSADYYYQNGATSDAIYAPFAPYYDVIKADSAAASGKNGKYKVTIVGYNYNVR